MAAEETRTEGSLAGATVTLATNGASAVVSLAFGIAAARWFGATGRGQVMAFMYWPSLVLLAAMLGIPTATTYYAAHRDRSESGAIIGTGTASVALSSLLAAGAVALLAPLLVGDGSPEVVEATRIFSVSIVLVGLLNVAYHPLRVLGHLNAWNGVRLLIDSTPMLALVAMMILSSRYLPTYALALLTVQAVVLAIGYSVVLRHTRPTLSRSWGLPLLKYGLPTVLATLPALLNFRVDQAFLVRMVDRSELGNYATAVAWSQSVLIVTNVIHYLVLPRVAPLVGGARNKEYDHLLRLSVLLIVMIVVPLTAVSPWAVPLLFGAGFSEAGRLCLIMVPAAGLLGLTGIAQEVLRTERRLRGPLVSQLLGLAVTAGAVLLLVPALGVWGAAVASIITYLAVTAMLGWYLRRMGMPIGAPFLVPHVRQFRAMLALPAELAGRLRRP